MSILRTVSLLILLCSQLSWADDKMKPYVLTELSYDSAAAAIEGVQDKLTSGGFQVAGQYSPYQGATIIVATSAALQQIASQTKNGGFGAVFRISVTETGGDIQVSYVNPDYLENIFRLADISTARDALTAALGSGSQFGAKKGMTAKNLRKYHYMMAMPYFDDVDKLAGYSSHEAAVTSIEANLAAGVAGTSKVYRVDLPGKNVALFGVAIGTGDGADATVMSIVDQDSPKHTAHLPYELLVNDGEVVALRGRFRIAQSFPDLTMGTFMKIRSAPGAIKDSLAAAAQAR